MHQCSVQYLLPCLSLKFYPTYLQVKLFANGATGLRHLQHLNLDYPECYMTLPVCCIHLPEAHSTCTSYIPSIPSILPSPLTAFLWISYTRLLVSGALATLYPNLLKCCMMLPFSCCHLRKAYINLHILCRFSIDCISLCTSCVPSPLTVIHSAHPVLLLH